MNWMEKAIELANKAQAIDEVPVGALLVCNNTVIGEGHNVRETSARVLGHAEIQAIEDYNLKSKQWRLPAGTSLYTTAEPCLMCTGSLIAARLDHIYFGCFDTKNAGLMRILPLIEQGIFDHKFKSVQGAQSEKECAKLLSDYFKSKRV
jgi:tRNA(adenine34) deaminase